MEINPPFSQYMMDEISKLNQFEEDGDITNYKNLMFAEYIEQVNNAKAYNDFKNMLNNQMNATNVIDKSKFAAKFSMIISDLTPIFDPPNVTIGDEAHPFTKIGITYEMFKNSHIKDTTFTDLPKIITNDKFVVGKWENPCIISGINNTNVNNIRIMLRTNYDSSFIVSENNAEIKVILMSKKIHHMFGIVSFTRVMTVLQNNDIVINNVWKVNFA
jgi:hypothetical protein